MTSNTFSIIVMAIGGLTILTMVFKHPLSLFMLLIMMVVGFFYNRVGVAVGLYCVMMLLWGISRLFSQSPASSDASAHRRRQQQNEAASLQMRRQQEADWVRSQNYHNGR